MTQHFTLQFTRRCLKELQGLPKTDAQRIAKALQALEYGLGGDIKKLSNVQPAYRLRVGDYRILFDLHGTTLDIQAVRHRREVYR